MQGSQSRETFPWKILCEHMLYRIRSFFPIYEYQQRADFTFEIKNLLELFL